MTKKYKVLFALFLVFSILLNIVPLATYTIIAFANSTVVVEKVALSLTLFIVLILSIISWVNKITMRSRLWILLIGLYVILDYIMTPLILIAVCQVIDELVATPIKKHYKNKYTIHREIDRHISG